MSFAAIVSYSVACLLILSLLVVFSQFFWGDRFLKVRLLGQRVNECICKLLFVSLNVPTSNSEVILNF